MATYKQPCVHCGEFIEGDSRFCAKCGSRTPFGFQCPYCLKEIERGNAVCSGCGKPLVVACPLCGGATFVGSERCDTCGRFLMIKCENKRCGEAQYFTRTSCSACGKTIKNAQEQITTMREGAR